MGYRRLHRLNRDVAVKAATLDWSGQLSLQPMGDRPGGRDYLPAYLAFMAALCVFPYLEENIRCLRHSLATAGALLIRQDVRLLEQMVKLGVDGALRLIEAGTLVAAIRAPLRF